MTGLELIAVNAAVTLVVGLVKLATRKKPDEEANVTREPSDAAIVSDGTTIGAVFGTVFIEDPNVLCWFSQSIAKATNNGVVYGDRLRANVVFGLCLGPIDALVQVELDGQHVAGPDSVGGTINYINPTFDRAGDGPFIDLSAVDFATKQVNKRNFYGEIKPDDLQAPEQSNTVDGYITAYNGLQTAAELTDSIAPTGTDSWDPTTQGAFSQVACVRLSGPTLGNNDESLQEAFNHGVNRSSLGRWAFWVERIMKRSHNAAQWYDTKAQIPINPEQPGSSLYGMNPAHIIHELLTDEGWGLGLPLTVIDGASFTAAADTLHTELFGLSFRLNSSQTAASVIDQVLRVIDAVLIETGDGTLKLKLIRELPTLDGLPVITTANASRATWVEAAQTELPTSVAFTYWSARVRRDRTYTIHNEAAIRRIGRKIVHETRAFGVSSAFLIRRLAARELLYVSRARATVEIDVHPSVALQLEKGDAFVLDWDEYPVPATVCRVLDIDYGTSDTDVMRIQAIEDVFHERGEWQGEPAESEHTNPVGDAITPVYTVEQAPYWMWERATSGGLLDLPELIAPTPATTAGRDSVWLARSVVYATRGRYDQNGFRIGEQKYDEVGMTGEGTIYEGPVNPFAPVVSVRTAYNRNLVSSAGAHLLDLDATGVDLTVGDVLRVPVQYDAIDFSAAPSVYQYDFGHLVSSFEFVLVVEVITQGALAEVRVVRGLFDTMPAKTITTGSAYVVGHVDCEPYAIALNWFDADESSWRLNGGLGSTFGYVAENAVDGEMTVDVRALGSTPSDAQVFADVASNDVKLISEYEASGAGFVARAARPIASGACSVSESVGDYTITAEPRDRTLPVFAPSGLLVESVFKIDAPAGAWLNLQEDGRTFECHVFGDGTWLGVKTYDSVNGEFVVTAADLTGWGGPFTTIEFAVLSVWKTNPPKPVVSYSYTWLKVTP